MRLESTADDAPEHAREPSWPELLLNGSEMGRRVHDFPWGPTSLGPIDAWPQSLRSHVAMLVDNKFPMYVFWGDENIALYNDGYIGILGTKHPGALGVPTRIVWNEVWPAIEPLIASVRRGDPPELMDAQFLVHRHGFAEEFHSTFCYSPLRDDRGRIAGVLATLTETTQRVLAHRRLDLIRDLMARSLASRSAGETLTAVAGALAQSVDLHYTGIYLCADGTRDAQLMRRTGATGAALPETIAIGTLNTRGAAAFGDPNELVAVPIMGADRRDVIGAFVAAKSAQLAMDDGFRAFAGLIAAQIGSALAASNALSLERTRADQAELSRSVERIRLFAESGQQLFWTARDDGYVDWYNDGWYDYTGQTAREAEGWGWQAVHHPDDLAIVMERWPLSLEQRAPFEMTFRLRGADGQYRWFLTRAVPELDATGAVTRWYGTNTNIDSERRATQQLDFFARIGGRVGRDFDRRSALRALVDGLVPALADWMLVNLVNDDGVLVLAEAYHRDPGESQKLEPFIGKSYDLPERASVSARVYQTGEPVFMSHSNGEMVRGGVQEAFGRVVVDLGMDSFITVPIEANGHRFGSFHALAVGSDKIYTELDVPFFMEVGRRMGYALQNAERFEREKRIAHAFQRAALPLELPDVPGLVFSSLYEPGSREANVGGDFFDAFRLLDGRVIMSIGDVAGSGVSAAATMAALRQSIRAIASVNPNAEMLLRAADGVFSDAGGPLFASAFVAVFDPLTFSLEYANAGHPAPILRAPDGTTTALGSTDLLLGLNLRNNDGSRHVYRIQTQPGSLLALYTDGLSEANYDALAGETQILDAVRNAPQTRTGAYSAAKSIRDAVLGAAGVSHDDMALLTVFLEKPIDRAAGMQSWTFAADDGESAHAARNGIMLALRACGVHDADVFSAETIYSELVGNGFRHAGGEVRVALDLTQDAPVLHVLDSGPGFFLNPKLPADAFAERGRGLFIVMELAREFSVSPRTTQQGSHARAVLYGRAGSPSR